MVLRSVEQTVPHPSGIADTGDLGGKGAVVDCDVPGV